MKKLLVISVVVFLTSFAAEAQELSVNAKNYLKQNYPNWKITESFMIDTPRRKAVVSGNFNGDGKTDYAVVIKKDNRIYALALIAAKNSYKAYNLLAQTEEDRWMAGLDTIKKGETIYSGNINNSSKSFRLKADGITISDAEGMARIYYWQNGKFVFAEEN